MVFGLFGDNDKKDKGAAAAPATSSPTRPGFESTPGCTALVTGSSGLCGARLVEMLLERGAKTVICFDLAAPDDVLAKRFEVAQEATGGKLLFCHGKEGNLTSDEAVEAAFSKEGVKIDVCYHIAALVGPFHDKELYYGVNYEGTMRIIAMCKKYKVPKLVYSTSPSTRFTGEDVEGATEDQLPIPDKFLALYAETKAMGEVEVTKACKSGELLTISVGPHQIYGPYDTLFMPNLLETAGTGRLRVFGSGRSIISVCYVDNYVHGLMCGADALYENSPALGKFYIITDGKPVNFWHFINQAIKAMGFTDLYTKWHLPVWLLYCAAYVANVIGFLMKKKLKLNPFNVRMLTMHRYFSLENAKKDLQFEPVVDQSEAWPSTIEWFKEYWLPKFKASQQSKKAK